MESWLRCQGEPAKKKRRQFTSQEKRLIVADAKSLGIAQAAKLHHTSERNVYRWRSEDVSSERFLESSNGRKRRSGTKTIFNRKNQDELLEKIERLRERGAAVACQDIQLWARHLAEENGIEDFKASNGWLRGFLDRNNLSVRCRTGDGYALPVDFENRTLAMITEVLRLQREFDVSDEHIINCDETAIFLDAVTARTVDHRGSKSVRVRSTGKEKSRVTCMIAVSMSGAMLKPMVILKGKSIGRLRNFTPSESARQGICNRTSCELDILRIFAASSG